MQPEPLKVDDRVRWTEPSGSTVDGSVVEVGPGFAHVICDDGSKIMVRGRPSGKSVVIVDTAVERVDA